MFSVALRRCIPLTFNRAGGFVLVVLLLVLLVQNCDSRRPSGCCQRLHEARSEYRLLPLQKKLRRCQVRSYQSGQR